MIIKLYLLLIFFPSFFLVGLSAYLLFQYTEKRYGLFPDEKELLKTYLNTYGPTGADQNLCDIYKKGPHFLYRLPMKPIWFQIGAPGSESEWNEQITNFVLEGLQSMPRRKALRFKIRIRRPSSSRYDPQYAKFGSGPIELPSAMPVKTFIKHQKEFNRLKSLPNTEEVIDFVIAGDNNVLDR